MVWLPDGGKSLSILYVVVVYYANFVFFPFFYSMAAVSVVVPSIKVITIQINFQIRLRNADKTN